MKCFVWPFCPLSWYERPLLVTGNSLCIRPYHTSYLINASLNKHLALFYFFSHHFATKMNCIIYYDINGIVFKANPYISHNISAQGSLALELIWGVTWKMLFICFLVCLITDEWVLKFHFMGSSRKDGTPIFFSNSSGPVVMELPFSPFSNKISPKVFQLKLWY